MTSGGFTFPTERRQYYGRGGFIGMGWSRHFRAHAPGLTDEQLDDLWTIGEEWAKTCTGFVKNNQPDWVESCVFCNNLPGCAGEREEVRPDLFQLIKLAFRHDLMPQ